MAWPPPGVDDRQASAAAARHGIEAAPLSCFGYAGRSERGGLVLGYGALPPASIASAMRTLAAALRSRR